MAHHLTGIHLADSGLNFAQLPVLLFDEDRNGLGGKEGFGPLRARRQIV